MFQLRHLDVLLEVLHGGQGVGLALCQAELALLGLGEVAVFDRERLLVALQGESRALVLQAHLGGLVLNASELFVGLGEPPPGVLELAGELFAAGPLEPRLLLGRQPGRGGLLLGALLGLELGAGEGDATLGVDGALTSHLELGLELTNSYRQLFAIA